MPKIHPAPFALALAAGAALAQSNTPSPIERESTNINPEHIAHIYYNIVTNEKIATRLTDNFRPSVGDPGTEQWLAANDQPCAAFGLNVNTSVRLDYTFPPSPLPYTYHYGYTMLDWGDIKPDTTIDCIEIHWIAKHSDTDTNADGIADGVEGFGMQWSFYDRDNGFNNCDRVPIIAFRLANLPGSLDGEATLYTTTLDLVGDLAPSIGFEFADSDGVLNTANTHNPFIFITDFDGDGLPDGDLDSDGLADMSYAVRYFQPGTTDLDNADGDNDDSTGIDGDFDNANDTFILVAAPFGTTVETDNGDGTFSYEIDTSTAAGANAFGAEDVWDEYDSAGYYDFSYWTGGFSCEDNPDNDTPNAFGQIKIQMFGPAPEPCEADLTGEGMLDIFDIFTYLDFFQAGSLQADWNSDGILDIFDAFAYLDAFNAGCP